MKKPERCWRCRSRACLRDGTCVPKRRRYGSLCEGRGHPGGPASQKPCSVCKVPKANTAFWNSSDICTACRNRSTLCSRCHDRQAEAGRTGGLCSACRKGGAPTGARSVQDLRGARVPFGSWMELIGASAADYEIVAVAGRRYGRRAPTPDDVLEEYGRDHHLPRKRIGELWHATVLAANEAHTPGTRKQWELSRSEAA